MARMAPKNGTEPSPCQGGCRWSYRELNLGRAFGKWEVVPLLLFCKGTTLWGATQYLPAAVGKLGPAVDFMKSGNRGMNKNHEKSIKTAKESKTTTQ
jgi:hypothetical protein